MRRDQALELVAWPSFLRGDSASQVYARLTNGDPLRLCEGAARRLRETWYLLEPERVYRHAQGTCAEAAVVEPPPADLDEWKRAKLDLTILRLVRADREAEQRAPELLDEEDMEFPLLTTCLFIEPELVRKCTVAFNALEPIPRRAFFELLLEGRELNACIESGPWDADGLYEAVHVALDSIGLGLHPKSGEGKKQ